MEHDPGRPRKLSRRPRSTAAHPERLYAPPFLARAVMRCGAQDYGRDRETRRRRGRRRTFRRAAAGRAVALAGSEAAGAAETRSDLDLYVYANEEIPLAWRRELALALGTAGPPTSTTGSGSLVTSGASA